MAGNALASPDKAAERIRHDAWWQRQRPASYGSYWINSLEPGTHAFGITDGSSGCSRSMSSGAGYVDPCRVFVNWNGRRCFELYITLVFLQRNLGHHDVFIADQPIRHQRLLGNDCDGTLGNKIEHSISDSK